MKYGMIGKAGILLLCFNNRSGIFSSTQDWYGVYNHCPVYQLGSGIYYAKQGYFLTAAMLTTMALQLVEYLQTTPSESMHCNYAYSAGYSYQSGGKQRQIIAVTMINIRICWKTYMSNIASQVYRSSFMTYAQLLVGQACCW